MTFLAPAILLALPLCVLPVIVHLIHLYRRRQVKWAAMIFLIAAQRMSKGLSRLRQILILALRVLLLLALILVVARPLSGGWLGLTGGVPETVLVLLDRSASMEEKNSVAGVSKREAGLRNLIKAIVDAVGSSTHLVLIDSATQLPVELPKPEYLLKVPQIEATDTQADLPGLLQSAADYIARNKTGRTDVWILSDLQTGDWRPSSGKWQSLRVIFAAMQGLRFHLLCYPQIAPDDMAVTVDQVVRHETADKAELEMNFHVSRHVSNPTPIKVPLSLDINGTTTAVTVDLKDNQLAVQGYTVPIDKTLKRGWGCLKLPADSFPENDSFYFVFDEPPVLQSVVVSDDAAQAGPVLAALQAGSDSNRVYRSTVLSTNRAAEISWEDTAFIVWNGALPKPGDPIAKQLQRFVTEGRSILFLPPENPNDFQLFGLSWGTWDEAGVGKPLAVNWWRNDEGLLANTRSGTALPVGELEISRFCGIRGDGVPLARINGHGPLLVRSLDPGSRVYFLGALPGAGESSLARDGVVMYAILQRALTEGGTSLGKAQMRFASAGALGDTPENWRATAPENQTAISQNKALRAGVFTYGDHMIALNRPPEEDQAKVLSSEDTEGLFAGLDFHIFNETLESGRSLTNEVWRTFLFLVGTALLLEALLCLPSKASLPVKPIQVTT